MEERERAESEAFIAIYVFTCKQCVTAGGGTIDNNINNNQRQSKLCEK